MDQKLPAPVDAVALRHVLVSSSAGTLALLSLRRRVALANGRDAEARALEDARKRILVLARSQLRRANHIISGPSEVADTLNEAVSIATGISPDDFGDRITLTGPSLIVPDKSTSPLYLLIHELTSQLWENVGDEAGKPHLTLQWDPAQNADLIPGLSLVIASAGVHRSSELIEDTSTSYADEVINSASQQLAATVSHRQDSGRSVCEIFIPGDFG